MNPEALLTLLPNTVLAGLVYLFGKREVARLEEEKAKTERNVEKILERIQGLDMRLQDVATRPMLSAHGDRLDARQGDLALKVRDIEHGLRQLDKELQMFLVQVKPK